MICAAPIYYCSILLHIVQRFRHSSLDSNEACKRGLFLELVRQKIVEYLVGCRYAVCTQRIYELNGPSWSLHSTTKAYYVV